MDTGGQSCEIRGQTAAVGDSQKTDASSPADVGALPLSALMSDAQALIENDVEFEEGELSIVVDVPQKPEPKASWASEDDLKLDIAGPRQAADYAAVSPHQSERRKNKTSGNRSRIDVSLDGKSLWEEFYRRGTEMIVNRAGRRMFPGFSVSITGLKPKTKYSMRLEVVLASHSRYKFLNAHWLAVGAAEPQPQTEAYVHPDSPNTGAFWMRHGVSFRKLKITNNKEKPGGNILLHSMHKYSLRLTVDEESKSADKLPQPPKNVLSVDFPETTFIAVTAYQNEEVTQLKISNNPFAKAFREASADLDWETAQVLYGNPAVFSPIVPQSAPPVMSGYLPSPNPWYMHPSIPSPSYPVQGGYPSGSCYPGFSAPPSYPPQLRHDFHWTQPQPPTHRMIDTEVYGSMDPHSVYTVPTSSTCIPQPDFEGMLVVNLQTPTSP